MTEDSVRDLLKRLSAGQVDAAWREFLERYSPLMLHLAQQYETDRERALDCFVYVTGALSDDGFRRLLKYRPDGPAQFRTWLSTVVANLCIDWRRHQRGRFRPVQVIAGLPALDQLVYRCLYVRGMTRDETLRALQVRFPEVTVQQLAEISARLFSSLTSRQRWQLSVRMAGSVSLSKPPLPDAEESAYQPEDPAPGPDLLAQNDQDHSRLEAALARLPSQQRLLIRLRYQQDLTLAEVARLAGLSDTNQAHRQIQAALAALAELLKCEDRQ
jgi:RNA polymerase sigma factor (sigma-70 family)